MAAGAHADGAADDAGPPDTDAHEADDIPDSRREAKKAKIDALWSQLSQKAAPPAKQPKAASAGLASLCRPASKKAKPKAEVRRRAGLLARRARPGASTANAYLQVPTDTAYVSAGVPWLVTCCCMLCSGAPAASPHHLPPSQTRPLYLLQAWMRELGLGSSKPKGSSQAAAAGGEDKKAVAAAALAAAKTAASMTAAQQYGKVVVTETRRFAGKDITVKKEVAADSKEAQKVAAAPAAAAAQPGEAGAAAAQSGDAAAAAAAGNKKAGLDAVLQSISQPKKVRRVWVCMGCWQSLGAAAPGPHTRCRLSCVDKLLPSL